jgi:hypothetical protein
MPPAPSVARRLALLGCCLLAGAASTLSACGGDGAATAEKTMRTAARKPAPRTVAGPCPATVEAFADSLERLRRQLAIGLSYEQYAARMKDLRAAYDRIPVDRLTIDCVAKRATAGERAFNKYVDAANAWGECLADAACTTATIEPVLQRQWRTASIALTKAK